MKHFAILALSLIVLAICAVPAAAQTPSVTPTPTSGFPQASTPTLTPTPSRTPAPTSTPFAIVNDSQFIQYNTAAWTKSGVITWTFGKMTLAPGASIVQNIAWITGTNCYAVTVRSNTPTSTTMTVDLGGIASSFVVSRTTNRTFGYIAPDVILPANISVSNAGAGALSMTYVGLAQRACSLPGMYGVLDAQAGGGVGPLPISDFLDYFTPLTLGGGFDVHLNVDDWPAFMSIVGAVTATVWQIGYVDILKYYIGMRVLLIGVMWVVGYVMTKIGHPLPSNEVVVMGQHTGINVPRGLPRLPSSGIYRTRGRR